MGAKKGVKFTEEHRRNMSLAQTGDKNHMFGKHMSEEAKKKMVLARSWYIEPEEISAKRSKSLMGHIVSNATRAKIGAANTGRVHSEETKLKNKIATLAKWQDPQYQEKVRDGLKQIWQDPIHRENMLKTNIGRPHTEEHKLYMSKVITELWKNPDMKARRSREHNGSWLGGISYEPYSPEFNETLKKQIKERDNYTCQICGRKCDSKTLSVHHIDYNKKHSTLDNLISLCANIKGEESCHIRTNNNRSYWQEMLSEKVANKKEAS